MPYDGMQLGRYHLIRMLGSGGMGEVYLADDTRINRQVAVKVIRNEASSYPNSEGASRNAQLFEREMKMISKLDHPHILPLFDYGEDTISGAKITYMVMPYRPEGSLANWLARHNTKDLLPPQDVAYFIAQAASALQYAHNNQIIHQDVKPSNFLMRDRQEQPQRPDMLLADFGVARFGDTNSKTSQTIRGTPAYMAPEQWEGHPTYESDQYALAVMTYELLTGKSPFEGGASQMMYKHLMTQPEVPSSVLPTLPKEVDTVLLRALSKKPEERYPNINAYASALQQALQVSASTSTGMTGPTYPVTHPIGKEIPVSLAITAAEALNGTRRTLNVGAQRVNVTIPAGAHNGQVLYMNDWDPSLRPQDPINPLVITLVIQSTTSIPTIVAGADAGLRSSPDQQATMMGSVPDLPNVRGQRTSGASYSGIAPYGPVTGGRPTPSGAYGQGYVPQIDPAQPTVPYESVAPQQYGAVPQPGPYSQQYDNRYGQYYAQPSAPVTRRGPSGPVVVLVVLLVLVLIAGSAAAIYYFTTTNHSTANNGNATATAQSLALSNAQTQTAAAQGTNGATATSAATGTAGATSATATAGAGNGTATATIGGQNATATATAGVAASATATASAGQTATAQVTPSPTATATATPTPTATAVPPTIAVSKTSVSATANATSTDCTYGAQAGGSTNNGWTCQITLTNKGASELDWTASNSSSSTTFYTQPASGKIAAQGTATIDLIVLDINGTGACPAATSTFTLTGQSNSAQVVWKCA